MFESKFAPFKKGQKQPTDLLNKKGPLKNLAIFKGKHLCWSQRLQHRYFPINTAKFLRTPILKNIYERLLLKGRSSPPHVLYQVSQRGIHYPSKHLRWRALQ